MTTNEKALQMHEQWNGKLETTAKAHVNSREDLAIAYPSLGVSTIIFWSLFRLEIATVSINAGFFCFLKT